METLCKMTYYKLTKVKYLLLIDFSTGYHIMMLDKYHHVWPHSHASFVDYRYKWPLFGAAPADDMLQKKIGDIFKNLQNMFLY